MVISNGAMKEVRGFEATLSVDKELKVGLISESFSLWLHLQKKCNISDLSIFSLGE